MPSPEKITKVSNHLFISNKEAAADLEILKSHKITHIIAVGNELIANFPKDFLYTIIPIQDTTKANMLPHFPKTFALISTTLLVSPTSKFLIHCNAGISRSSTLVIAYLMKFQSLSYTQAFECLSKIYPTAAPNDGFVKQLNLWENMGFAMDIETSAEYRKWRLELVSYERIEFGINEQVYGLADSNGVGKGKKIRCKKCRKTLATEENLISHVAGSGQESFSYHKRDTKQIFKKLYEPQNTKGDSCNTYFLEAMDWMKEVGDGGIVEGKFGCECGNKLGGFNWYGSNCSCGAWIVPSFSLAKGKVDFY